jgi:hypothetical protein
MLFKIVKIGIHIGAHSGNLNALLDVFGSLYEPYSAHDMVSVFHSEDFPNLFRDRYPSSGYDLSKEWNVLLIHLNWQSDRRANGCIRPVI